MDVDRFGQMVFALCAMSPVSENKTNIEYKNNYSLSRPVQVSGRTDADLQIIIYNFIQYKPPHTAASFSTESY